MSEQPKDGGPAFPFSPNDHSTARMVSNGMSLRDWFAGHAQIDEDNLSALLAEKLMGGPVPNWQQDMIAATRWWAEAEAKLRYIRADAMLAARGQA